MTTTDVNPMLASKCDEPFSTNLLRAVKDDAWALEPKVDGDRMMIDLGVDGDHGLYRARNRSGEATAMPDTLRRAIADAYVGGAIVLDGEWLSAEQTYVVFDIPVAGGMVTPAMPYRGRRDVLEFFFQRWDPPPCIALAPAARGTEDKGLLAQRVIAARGEGFVAKRLDSPYVAGKPKGSAPVLWRKVKHTKDLDAVVTRLGIDGKNNYEIALYRDGVLTPVGEVSRLTGDKDRIEPDMVVTVTYLYAGVNDRLVQPVKGRIRTDKRPEECTWDQMQYTNRQAYLAEGD